MTTDGTNETNPSTALATLEGATRALAEARTLDEIKAVVDLAEAAKTYARAAKLGLEAQNYAAEITLRGKRKAGAILAQLDKSQGGRPPQTADRQSGVSEYRRAIVDAEVPEKAAQRWQKVASVEDAVFETYLGDTRGDGGEITEAGLLRVAKKYEQAAEPATAFEANVETGFLTKETALTRSFESAVGRDLKSHLAQGLDKWTAAEVLRQFVDALTRGSIVDAEGAPVAKESAA